MFPLALYPNIFFIAGGVTFFTHWPWTLYEWLFIAIFPRNIISNIPKLHSKFSCFFICLLCQFRIAHNDRNITVIIGGTRVGFLHRLIGNLPLIEFALNAKPNTILFRNNINTMVAGTRSHLCLGKTFFQQTVCTVTLKVPTAHRRKIHDWPPESLTYFKLSIAQLSLVRYTSTVFSWVSKGAAASL